MQASKTTGQIVQKTVLILMSVIYFSIQSSPIQSWAAEKTTVNSLLQRGTRPTVQQIRDLLKTCSPSPLKNEELLPKDKNKPRYDLQRNYPIWFRTLINGAPQMIATFEKAFPGATWAFIGRDMAILADLFEAFYDSLGQPPRVVRVGMSRGTMEGLTSEGAFQLLQSSSGSIYKLGIYEKMHPFILVDAVSRGGGRQARFLLNSIYKNLQTELQTLPSIQHPSGLFPYFNFIGLRVFTTSVPKRDLRFAEQYLFEDSIYWKNFDSVDFDTYQILTYTDGNTANEFINTNEAGYDHWTGAWHGSYGPLETRDGRTVAQVGPLNSVEMRLAILNFQANVIHEVRKTSFLKKVQHAALDLDFVFPLTRPGDRTKEQQLFENAIHCARNINEILDLIKKMKTESFSTLFCERMWPQIEKKLSLELERISHNISSSSLTPGGRLEEHLDALCRLLNLQSNTPYPLFKYKTLIDLFMMLELEPQKIDWILEQIPRLERAPLVRKRLNGSKTTRDFLNTWKQSQGVYADEQNLIDFFDSFWKLHPRVDEINELISSASTPSRLHYEIVIRAMSFLENRAEYKKLIKPSEKRVPLELRERYKKAKSDFKRDHPRGSPLSFLKRLRGVLK